MRSKIFIAASLFVLALFNWSIWQKELVLRDGETVLLELAPVDPRSLMQGDYMRLNYKVDTGLASGPELPVHGHIVIATDEEHIAHFVRVDAGQPLAPGEKRLRFHHDAMTRVVPDSFMFQEGQADVYRRAKYGVFKFDGADRYVLAGLADANRQPLVAPVTPLSFTAAAKTR